jgi:Amt family ammonium transporter
MACGLPASQLKWLAAGVVVFALTFTGLFIPSGPTASPEDLQQLNSGDTSWVLASTALVLFMSPGLAFFYGGMVRHHSIISTMLLCIVCIGMIGVLWIVVAFSLAFGDDCGGFIGNPWTYLWFRNVGTAPNPDFAATIPFCIFAMFECKFAVLTPALTIGGFVERIRFPPFLAYTILWTLIIYCPVAHWVWHPKGFLRVWGIEDFAGGSVVHITCGFSALAGALVVGRREVIKRGEEVSPTNIPFVILGTGMLCFGWFGFNAGSALAADQIACLAFMNTSTAGASGMLMWMVMEGGTGQMPSTMGACIGLIVGLAAVTPACGFITVGQSLFVGSFTVMVSFTAVWLMRKSLIDDGLDTFATHGVGGLVGCILTGAFNQQGPVYGVWKHFGYYWAWITIVAAWSFCWSFAILWVLQRFVGLRLSPAEEDGLAALPPGEAPGMRKGTLPALEMVPPSTPPSSPR